MSKRIVFLLHGMGVQPTGWEAPFVAAIQAAWGSYPFLAEMSIDDSIEFVPVQYDDIFQEIVKTWADNATLVQAAAAELGAPALVLKLTGWLKGAGQLRGNFGWTHAADVLLYRCFRLVRERVCVHVAEQITRRINAEIESSGSCTWSAIAHSLGTAVLHDTLARLWQPGSNLPGVAGFAPENVQAQLIMMVANVSRVLEINTDAEPYDVYQTAVKPGFPGQPQRGCRYMLNVRHRLDPFTIPKMFNPQLWPDEHALTARPARYVHVEIDHIHEMNVHDCAHYLKHPAVHVPMLRRLMGSQVVSDDDLQRALDRFRVFGPLEDAAAIALKQKLESILPSQAEDWLSIGRTWKQFQSLKESAS